MAEIKKKKKKHRLLVSFIIILFVIVLPIGFVYALFYDGSSTTNVGGREIQLSSITRNKFVDAFDGAKESGQLKINITQTDLNDALYLAQSNLAEREKKYLKGMEIEITGSSYLFALFVDANFVGFKSKITLDASFSDDGEFFYLKVNNAKIGRASHLDGIVKNIAKNFITQADIDRLLSDLKLSLTFSLEKMTFFYKKADVAKDLQKMLEENKTDDDIKYSSLVSSIFLNHDISFDYYQNKSFNAVVDMKKSHSNEEYYTSEKEGAGDIVYKDAKIESLRVNHLLDSKAINDEEVFSNSYVLQLLMVGYSNLSTAAQQYVDSIDLSSIGILNASTVTGHSYSTGYDLEANITSSLPGIAISGEFSIGEEDLNLLFGDSGVIGYSIYIADQRDTPVKSAVITVNNFYVNVWNDHLAFTIGVSVGGYDIYFIIDTVIDSEKSLSLPYGIVLKTDNAMMGQVPMKKDLQSYLLDIISEAMKKHRDNWFSVNSNAGEVTIDFRKCVPDSLKATLPAIDISLNGTSTRDTGKLTIKKA